MMKRRNEPRILQPSIYSAILLFLAITLVFIIPVFPQSTHKLLYNVIFTGLILFASLSMDLGRGTIFKIAAATILIEWIGGILNFVVLVTISQIALLGFFVVIIISLISQIARTKRVTMRVIIESITGYLLLGIVFSLIIMVIAILNSDSFNFPSMDANYGSTAYHHGDIIYYTFVTFTTLGYGDMLPLAPYAKSIAILSAVCGQIYLTVIIAMLVGKFLSYSRDET